MKTQRLAFSQLHDEFEVLDRENLSGIKGGNVIEYGTNSQGLVYYRSNGGEWQLYEGISLNEVTIYGEHL